MAQRKPARTKMAKRGGRQRYRDRKTDKEMEVEKDKEQTDTGRCTENDSQREINIKHRERKTDRARLGRENKETRKNKEPSFTLKSNLFLYKSNQNKNTVKFKKKGIP